MEPRRFVVNSLGKVCATGFGISLKIEERILGRSDANISLCFFSVWPRLLGTCGKRIQRLVEMVHRGIMNRSGRMELKVGHVVLLVLLCDTYAVHHVYIIISQVLVVVWVLECSDLSYDILQKVTTLSVLSNHRLHVWSYVFLSVRNVFS